MSVRPCGIDELDGEASVCELVDGEDGGRLFWKNVDVSDGDVIAILE